METSVSRSTLADPVVTALFAEMYRSAERADAGVLDRAYAAAAAQPSAPTVEEVTEWCGDAALPVAPAVGRLLYLLTRVLGARTVVEFGTSFGTSLVYLAAAVRDNGGDGLVYGSEMHPRKAARARANLGRAGLAEHVRILEGDARETLRDLPGPVDLVLLDGWKDLYLPVLEVLEPAMRPGTLVVADNLDMLPAAYLERVRSGGGYTSLALPLGDGIELSLRA